MRVVKVLIGAYACEPSQGSEPAVGWHWAHEAVCAGHDVWVVTRRNNRPAIEAALATADAPAPHFEYLDLPRPFLLGQAPVRPSRPAGVLLPLAGRPHRRRAAAAPSRRLRHRPPRHVRQRHAAQRALRPAHPVRLGTRRRKHPSAPRQHRPRPAPLRPSARAGAGGPAVPARAGRSVRGADAPQGEADPRLHPGGTGRPVAKRAAARPRDRAHRGHPRTSPRTAPRRRRRPATFGCGSSPADASSTGRATTCSSRASPGSCGRPRRQTPGSRSPAAVATSRGSRRSPPARASGPGRVRRVPAQARRRVRADGRLRPLRPSNAARRAPGRPARGDGVRPARPVPRPGRHRRAGPRPRGHQGRSRQPGIRRGCRSPKRAPGWPSTPPRRRRWGRRRVATPSSTTTGDASARKSNAPMRRCQRFRAGPVSGRVAAVDDSAGDGIAPRPPAMSSRHSRSY